MVRHRSLTDLKSAGKIDRSRAFFCEKFTELKAGRIRKKFTKILLFHFFTFFRLFFAGQKSGECIAQDEGAPSRQDARVPGDQ